MFAEVPAADECEIDSAELEPRSRECSAHTSASNFVPLWAGAQLNQLQAERSIEALKRSGLLADAGVLTTDIEGSGQQWDAPNAWPPLQDMLVEGLAASGTESGEELALDLTRRWLNANFVAWKATGHMHEKYNAETGQAGGGGEYVPQTGFGWTNGVVLRLLERYGDRLAVENGNVVVVEKPEALDADAEPALPEVPMGGIRLPEEVPASAAPPPTGTYVVPSGSPCFGAEEECLVTVQLRGHV
jgi:hypothetical protein